MGDDATPWLQLIIGPRRLSVGVDFFQELRDNTGCKLYKGLDILCVAREISSGVKSYMLRQRTKSNFSCVLLSVR